jgi:hypothetical protein
MTSTCALFWLDDFMRRPWRLWGLMHKTVTHNRCYATYNGFCEAVLGFLRRDVPNRWNTFCDSVTDNFRIISPEDFRVLR